MSVGPCPCDVRPRSVCRNCEAEIHYENGRWWHGHGNHCGEGVSVAAPIERPLAEHTQRITMIGDPHDGGPVGDCLRASVASLLGMDPATVPHFAKINISDPRDSPDCMAWWYAFVGWAAMLEPSVSVRITDDVTDDAWPTDDGWLNGCCLATGPSPRGDWLHTVVARRGVVLWDPHPSRAGLPKGITELTVLERADQKERNA